MIRKHLKNYDIFLPKTVEIDEMKKEINNVNPKKEATNNNIPPKILKSLLKFQQVFYISYLTI